MQLTKKIFIKGQIVAETGLMIGGSNAAIGIGGVDKMVIRNPIDNLPLIPGSSLKGKMRALLELKNGNIDIEEKKENGKTFTKYKPSTNTEVVSTWLFGTATGDTKQKPSRLIIRDCKLSNGSVFEGKTDLPYSESKVEVTIDRITSQASPRTFERVPAGATFNFEFIVNVIDEDSKTEIELMQCLYEGMLLLQDDYLGGSGSRGYGKLSFDITSVTCRADSYYKDTGKEEKYTLVSIPSDLQKQPTT